MDRAVFPAVPVLASGEGWAVVAKPSGLAMHRSKMVHESTVMIDLLRAQFDRKVHLVHRLDRPTSGCLLIAFDAPTATRLHQAMKEATKRYLAFCRGHVTTRDPVDVDFPMKDDQGVLRSAHTKLRCLASCPDPRSALILAEPLTGRYHQVRRHIRDLSHPVLGDAMHGDTRVNRWWRENYGLPRLGLHCLSLSLPEPVGIEVTCPVPEDLASLWRRLPWWDEAVAALPELRLAPVEPSSESP